MKPPRWQGGLGTGLVCVMGLGALASAPACPLLFDVELAARSVQLCDTRQ